MKLPMKVCRAGLGCSQDRMPSRRCASAALLGMSEWMSTGRRIFRLLSPASRGHTTCQGMPVSPAFLCLHAQEAACPAQHAGLCQERCPHSAAEACAGLLPCKLNSSTCCCGLQGRQDGLQPIRGQIMMPTQRPSCLVQHSTPPCRGMKHEWGCAPSRLTVLMKQTLSGCAQCSVSRSAGKFSPSRTSRIMPTRTSCHLVSLTVPARACAQFSLSMQPIVQQASGQPCWCPCDHPLCLLCMQLS